MTLIRRFNVGSRRYRRRASPGQSMVEFMLLLPVFIVLIIGIMEFAVAFNALLAVNFASRDAALLAAEAGSDSGADCIVLSSVEADVGPPANTTWIQQVRIYHSDQQGNELVANVYNRGGSTSCLMVDGTTITVPYTLGVAGYPEADRCDIMAGCGPGHPGVDTIGVSITYSHSWITPLARVVTLSGTGFTFTHSNAMRMEPVL